jgi:hypothetical protein
MTRWLWVAGIILLTALALLGVRRFEPERDVLDELFAYEVTQARSVRVRVPGGLREILVTSWAVIPPQAGHAPADRYRYALDVSALSADGERLVTRRTEIQSRISGDPTAPRQLGEYAARLEDGSAWLSDPRTQRFDVSVLQGRAGYVEVRAAPTGARTILVRLAFKDERGALERDIIERRLSADARRRLLARSTSLGFVDLPAEVRSETLSHSGRRLLARGREGVAYVGRRVLVGDYRDSLDLEPGLPPSAPIGPDRWAALNLRGRAALRLYGSAGIKVHVEQSGEPPLDLTMGPEGSVDHVFEGHEPRTLTFSADRAGELRFSVPPEDQRAQIGQFERSESDDGRVWVVPDTIAQRYLRLDPAVPVRMRMAPGQRAFGVTLRAMLDEKAAYGTVDLSVSYDGTERRYLPPWVVDLSPSPYESADGGRVTESRIVLVSPPPGVTDVLLTGSRSTLVALWTDEPGVSMDRLAPAYDLPLEPEEVWRYAPKLEQTFAAIRPSNDEPLDADGRPVRVVVQPRIESLESGRGQRIAERTLEPVGGVVQRHLYRPLRYVPGPPVPAEAWTRLDPEHPGESTRILASDTTARLLYRVPAEALGQSMAVLIDGSLVLEHALLSTAGQVTFALGRGPHLLSLAGIERADEMWLRAVPAAGGTVFKSQRTYRLSAEQGLTLRFERRPGELLALLVTVASEQRGRRFELSYEVDPGRPPTSGNRLYRRLTRSRGVLTGQTGSAGRGLIWEAVAGPLGKDPLPHGVAQARIPLGDDLRVGTHRLQLRFTARGGAPLWVRAITVGRRDASDWGTDS